MSFQNILTEIDAGVGIVTLNRPEHNNALDAAAIAELSVVMHSMAHDPAVRVVVISSIGKNFCGGTDLAWGQCAGGADPASHWRAADTLAEMLQRIAACPKPVIARVQGPAYGSGVGVIAACDIAVTTFDARFALTEDGYGPVPASVGPHVLAAIGERYARRYLLTAEVFSAAEAYRIGLLHEMVADEAALDAAVGEWVEAILKSGPQILAEYKAWVRAPVERAADAQIIDTTGDS